MTDMIGNSEGFVLIGGASSRMGRDKAEMVLGGRKLFERSVESLSTVCQGNVTLVGKVTSDLECDLPVISDISIDSLSHRKAPIIGLLTALTFAKTPWIVILACDLPFVTAELMKRIAGFCSSELDAIVPVQLDERPQPLCAFYRRERCIPVVEAMIKRKELKMQDLLSHVRTQFVQFDEIADLDGSADFFLNVNDPRDYETAATKADA
ncbi:MAG: molybdenum cofactor guanylyltransferase [Pyrinomonadaceae bacterium]